MTSHKTYISARTLLFSISVFFCWAAQMAAEPFTRDHNVHTLFQIQNDNVDTFCEAEGTRYSLMKYGNHASIRHYAEQIADLIWKDWGEDLAEYPEQWRVVSPAKYSLKTAACRITDEVRRLLQTKYGVHLAIADLGRRKTLDNDFGELVDADSRCKSIFGSFCYEGDSLAGLSLIFVEDALVSGAHYLETQRVLAEQASADLEQLHTYCVVDVLQDTSERSLEHTINHVWISSEHRERLLPVLADPSDIISPRVLKFVLQSAETTNFFAARLAGRELWRIHSAALRDGFSKKPAFRSQVKVLENILSERLSAIKLSYGLKCVYHVDEANIDSMGDLAESYSLMKYGHPGELQEFATDLASLIQSELGDKIESQPEEWAVVTSGYRATPGAGFFLGQSVAKQLGVKFIQSTRRETPAISYGKVSNPAVRNRLVARNFELHDLPPNVIFVDDAVASGAHLKEYGELITAEGATMYPFAIVDVDSVNCALENRLNRAVISEEHPDVLLSLLMDPEVPILVRTLKTLLGFSPEGLIRVLKQLPLERVVQIYNAITRDDLDKSPIYQDSLFAMNTFVNQECRTIKALSLPPYQTLLVLNDKNAESLLGSEGIRYSQLKYGHPKIIAEYAEALASRIRALYGKDIEEFPRKWAVASAGYYRTPNAASFLGDRVAEILGLERADLRARGIFEGEFGGINDPKRRQEIVRDVIYVSNPNRVQGRRVLYIDDVYVSGAHLIEHERLLREAGADDVLPFAIFDVASRELKLEKALNYALVDRSNLRSLLDIIQAPEAPILTRTAKFILRLNQRELDTLFAMISDQKLFEIMEACEAEEYGSHACFAESFAYLKKEAMQRHIASAMPLDSTYRQTIRLMLLDYDGTLAEPLTALSDEMAEHLVAFLEEGVELAVVTMQPLGKRGVQEFFVGPLKSYLQNQEKDAKLLQRLHLFPCGGMEYYTVGVNGLLREDDPIYNVGIQPSIKQELEALVEKEVSHLTSKVYLRQGYISLHFEDAGKLQEAQEILAKHLESYPSLGVFNQSHLKNKQVLHLRSRDLSKIVARTQALTGIKRSIEKRLGIYIDRRSILTAGDRMGHTVGLDSDSKFFVYGGINLALGDEAVEGAYDEYLNQGYHGLADWFRKYRAEKKVYSMTSKVRVNRRFGEI